MGQEFPSLTFHQADPVQHPAWDKVAKPRWPLSAYYADLKARRYIRAFVRAGGSPGERSRRGRVIDHWLLDKKVSSVEIVVAIKRAKSDR